MFNVANGRKCPEIVGDVRTDHANSERRCRSVNRRRRSAMLSKLQALVWHSEVQAGNFRIYVSSSLVPALLPPALVLAVLFSGQLFLVTIPGVAA